MSKPEIIIAYISPEIESQQRERIAEMLRMRMIQTTDNIHCATVIIEPRKNVTVADIAEILIEQTQQDLDEMTKQIIAQHMHDLEQDAAAVGQQVEPKKNKHSKFIQPRNLTKFNNIKQMQKRAMFNRTRNK